MDNPNQTAKRIQEITFQAFEEFYKIHATALKKLFGKEKSNIELTI